MKNLLSRHVDRLSGRLPQVQPRLPTKYASLAEPAAPATSAEGDPVERLAAPATQLAPPTLASVEAPPANRPAAATGRLVQSGPVAPPATASSFPEPSEDSGRLKTAAPLARAALPHTPSAGLPFSRGSAGEGHVAEREPAEDLAAPELRGSAPAVEPRSATAAVERRTPALSAEPAGVTAPAAWPQPSAAAPPLVPALSVANPPAPPNPQGNLAAIDVVAKVPGQLARAAAVPDAAAAGPAAAEPAWGPAQRQAAVGPSSSQREAAPIRISIGRIEVRANPAPVRPPGAAGPATKGANRTSMAELLRQSSGRRS